MTSFTVAIPTHNRRETVVLAALSAVRQSRKPKEVLVLCDGCTDGTSDAIAALKHPRIRAIDLPKGPGYAYAHRNVAVEEGRGDVVTWLADDDLYLPDHFKRIGRLWDSGSFDLVAAPAVIVHEDNRLEWIGRDWRIPEHRRVLFEETNTNVMASVSVRRELVADVGGWDGSFERAADWDLWKRVLSHGARPAMTHEATVLHFRATTRRQAWSLRVRQNEAWFASLSDAARQAELRDELRVARSAFEGAFSAREHHVTTQFERTHAITVEQEERIAGLAADLTAAQQEGALASVRIRELTDAAASARAAAVSVEEAAAALTAENERLAADNERLRAELSTAHDERAGLEPALEAGRQDRATLERIYAGGWWRLRGVVRAALAPLTAAQRWLGSGRRARLRA